MQLFRQQAIDHQHRLYGEVLLVRPLPWQAIGWLLMILAASCALFLAFGSYSRTVAASGTISHDGRIELRVPASAIAQVANGQPVRFVPDASLSPGDGMFQGVVEHVDMISAKDRQANFRVIARIELMTGRQRARGTALRPGQSLNARIIVGHRSLFHWLTRGSNAAAQP